MVEIPKNSRVTFCRVDFCWRNHHLGRVKKICRKNRYNRLTGSDFLKFYLYPSKGNVFFFSVKKFVAHSFIQNTKICFFFFRDRGKKNKLFFYFSQEKFIRHSFKIFVQIQVDLGLGTLRTCELVISHPISR